MSDTAIPVLTHPGLGALSGLFTRYALTPWPKDAAEREAFLADVAPTLRAAVVLGSAGLPAPLAAFPALGAICCLGAGYDGVDLAGAKARGVAVANTPGANAEDVADVALGLLLSVARGVASGDRLIRAGAWTGLGAGGPPPRAVSDLKVGIVGLGAIGVATAVRVAAFGCDIRWTGPRPKPDAPYPYEPDLSALAAWADVLILALRPDPGTEKMIDAGVLAALGPDGYVINVARGSVVDEDALIDALKAGRIAGAGLDVFETEPTPAARWADVPNVTLTPHIAGGTRASILRMVQMTVQNLDAHFAGAPIPYRVA
jgi:lactate dehydrogenase-like 2-hydroxyacid dehydrogenase